ncbi:MAG: TIGR02757 family protein [Prevotellaceae bacterium]|nr:TIGR02757 family protein [Prevotellaceae bacterium]MDY3365925.1 TIGR02757 family protein [Prevotella sp.]
MIIDDGTRHLLIAYAEKYEQKSFIETDPVSFVHRVKGERNQEVMGFIASWLSYGSRKQFMPKINRLIDWSKGEIYQWVKSGEFKTVIPANDDCFYRLYNNRMIHNHLYALQQLLIEHHSLKNFIAQHAHDGLSAVQALCQYYASHKCEGIIPKTSSSASKRLCMYLRWMVRENSPVDLGIWKDIIPAHSLIMPLDTHVIKMANQLGLITSKTQTMKMALHLTAIMKEVFPNDPLKGDFALYGHSVAQMDEHSIPSTSDKGQ